MDMSGPPRITAASSSWKADEIMSYKACAVCGACSDGLMMTRLPAAMAPAMGEIANTTGKLQALIIPSTPFGEIVLRGAQGFDRAGDVRQHRPVARPIAVIG